LILYITIKKNARTYFNFLYLIFFIKSTIILCKLF